MTDRVAKVVDCQRLADRLIENKGSLEGDTVLRHDPDEGCAACPLQSFAGEYYSGREVCTVKPDPDISPRKAALLGDHRYAYRETPYDEPAPGWCPLRKGRVVVERGES